MPVPVPDDSSIYSTSIITIAMYLLTANHIIQLLLQAVLSKFIVTSSHKQL